MTSESLRLFVFRSRFLALLLALPLFQAQAQYTNGIYAEFTTSMGSFTCRLDHALAPKAVANFVGLATGQRPWLDAATGRIRRDPFFDGTTFHRVIADFMIQGGSRNGMGTDGPGYQFKDETNGLHNAFGILSMANAGPDSQGAQFFVTVKAQPSLDHNYSVFGRVFGGSNVVYAINRVATDGSDKPLTNVVLQTVRIQRVGAEAQAFDIHAHGLPAVTNTPLRIARAGTNVMITFSNRLNVKNLFYGTTNLNTLLWSGGVSAGYETSLPLVHSITLNAPYTREFFKMIQVQYPDALFVPRTINGRVLTLTFDNGPVVTITVGTNGVATYTDSDGKSGNVVYTWKQDPYRGRLDPLLLSGYGFIMSVHLDFDSATAGTFRGSAYLISPLGPVSGSFTASP